MKPYIALIRGINVGGNKMVKMDALRTFCESLGLANVKTLLQSGNVVFQAKSDKGLAKRMEDELQAKVVLRTPDEVRDALAVNPFPKEAEDDPSHLVIIFLSSAPDQSAQNALRDAYKGPEPMHFSGRELYVYYDGHMADSKLTVTLIERKLGVAAATARNWNTVKKLLAAAENLR